MPPISPSIWSMKHDYIQDFEYKTLSLSLKTSLSSLQDKTQWIILCHFPALYIFTQKLIHTKCPTLLKGTSKKKCKLSVVYSQRTPCPQSLSPRSSVWVSVGWREMWREMSGAADGSLLCCARALEPLVAGQCQVGSAAGPARGLAEECSFLISCKGALKPPKEKQTSL